MDTVTISQYIKPHQRGGIFKGVYPCDSLPSNFKLPAAFVINLSCHDEPGTHWVAIYIAKSGYSFYFDSFGMKPANFHIQSFLRKHSKSFRYNKQQLQHISSNKCGQFCCVFVVSVLKNCSVDNFLRSFGINLFVNDITVKNMFNYMKKK